jgi:hypothetical protein
MATIPLSLFATALLSGDVLTAATEPLNSWAEIPKPNSATMLLSVASGNGLFVAVGNGRAIITSTAA